MTDTTTAPMTQFAGASPVPGMSYTGNGQLGTYVQSVDPSTLESGQLAELLRSDNPIVQQAAEAAQGYAAARGGGVSGTQAIAASNNAMYGILTPVAGADASRYADVANANQSALDAMQQQRLQNAGSLAVANTEAGASRAATSERQHEFDVQDSERAQNRQWQLADQATSAEASARSQLFGNAESAIFSNPDFWSDPAGAMGALNEFGSNFDNMFNSLFPEYNENLTNAGQPAGGNGP